MSDSLSGRQKDAKNMFFDRANQAFLDKKYKNAAVLYLKAYLANPSIEDQVHFNLKLIQSRMPHLDLQELKEKALAAQDSDVGRRLVLRFFDDGPSYRGLRGTHNYSYVSTLNMLLDMRADNGALAGFVAVNEEKIDQMMIRFPGGAGVGRPLVSVIMPTFNRADILAESVASVLQQSYDNFELIICDDGSVDDTAEKLASFQDARVVYLKQDNMGAAAARNTALRCAKGDYITYLDSDNQWHPAYLELVLAMFSRHPGRSALYFDFIDYHVRKDGSVSIKSTERPEFDHEQLLKKPFIDLNTFAHRRELYDLFGGFDETLSRRQDYDVMLKYTWLRDPLHIPICVALYQRNDALAQITRTQRHDMSPVERINRKINKYFAQGLPVDRSVPVKKVSVIIWDHCRNHFSKPFAVAEALAEQFDVELIAFDFFNEGIFAPLQDVTPKFATKYFSGSDFPDFFTAMKSAAEAVTGDIMYVVKPRLPSLGLAMLVNATRCIPYVIESNDLETIVSSPSARDQHQELRLSDVALDHPELMNPYSAVWSQIFEPLVKRSPVVVTHNQGLDAHYDYASLYMRNLKDESVYNPNIYDRNRIRSELGFHAEDRIILFGGLLRKHKGIYELIELVERLNDPRYKLLFVGSRPTPDQKKLIEQFGDRVKILPPQDREGMARINYAADLVVLWLDPKVAASHYQFPYKATDAFAMQTAVIANDISDLGDLGRQGYLRLVPFGDWEAMTSAIQDIFSDPESTSTMVAAARRLYLRQFGYRAARANFQIAAYRAIAQSNEPFAVAVEFKHWFDKFYQHLTNSDDNFADVQVAVNLTLKNSERLVRIQGFGLVDVDHNIFFVAGENSALAAVHGHLDVCVVLLAQHDHQALQAARLFVKRADYPIHVFIVDAKQSNTQQVLTELLSKLSSNYVFLADEHAFPCRNWLEFGYNFIQEKQASFLFANTGYTFHPQVCLPVNEYVFAKREQLLKTLGQLSQQEEGSNFAGDWWQAMAKCLRQERKVYSHAWLLVANMGPVNDSVDFTPNSTISLVDVQSLQAGDIRFKKNICVIMPCIDHKKGLMTAALLQQRAGVDADIVVVKDTLRQGFIKTLNQAARATSAEFIVYLAEDAFPGQDWLKVGVEKLQSAHKSLLAFNCGKWHGRVAAFGLVRRQWLQKFYQDMILFDGYKSHRADNEITVLARASGQFAYTAKAVLLEDDPGKDFKVDENVAANFSIQDKKLFMQRFRDDYPRLVDENALLAIQDEYLNQRKLAAEKAPLKIES